MHVRFQWDDDELLIKMCLAPNDKPHVVHHGANPTCTLEV